MKADELWEKYGNTCAPELAARECEQIKECAAAIRKLKVE